MANYQAPDTEFQAVANAIRTKGGTQAQLEWPNGFVSAVQAIPSGTSEYPVLPNGYDRLLYVKSFLPDSPSASGTKSDSNGTFINTGVNPTNNTKIRAVFSNKVDSRNWYSLGGVSDSSNQVVCYYTKSENRGYTFRHGNQDTYIDVNVVETGPVYCAIIEPAKYFIDDSAVQYVGNIFSIEYPLHIFCCYKPLQSPVYGNAIEATLYSFKIWEQNVLIRNFIPCARKSDSEVGLYDIVNNTFYTSLDSSYSFEAGPKYRGVLL